MTFRAYQKLCSWKTPTISSTNGAKTNPSIFLHFLQSPIYLALLRLFLSQTRLADKYARLDDSKSVSDFELDFRSFSGAIFGSSGSCPMSLSSLFLPLFLSFSLHAASSFHGNGCHLGFVGIFWDPFQIQFQSSALGLTVFWIRLYWFWIEDSSQFFLISLPFWLGLGVGFVGIFWDPFQIQFQSSALGLTLFWIRLHWLRIGDSWRFLPSSLPFLIGFGCGICWDLLGSFSDPVSIICFGSYCRLDSSSLALDRRYFPSGLTIWLDLGLGLLGSFGILFGFSFNHLLWLLISLDSSSLALDWRFFKILGFKSSIFDWFGCGICWDLLGSFWDPVEIQF